MIDSIVFLKLKMGFEGLLEIDDLVVDDATRPDHKDMFFFRMRVVIECVSRWSSHLTTRPKQSISARLNSSPAICKFPYQLVDSLI